MVATKWVGGGVGGVVWGAGASERGGVEERTGGPPCTCGVWGRTVVAHVVGNERGRIWYNIGGEKQRL